MKMQNLEDIGHFLTDLQEKIIDEVDIDDDWARILVQCGAAIGYLDAIELVDVEEEKTTSNDSKVLWKPSAPIRQSSMVPPID